MWLVVVAAATAHAQAPPPPDTILVNGHVITVDARFSIAEAVAIGSGKFTAIGTNADIRKLAAANTQTIDLHGATVIPGLADDHLHDAGGGPGVDLSRARSLLQAFSAQVELGSPSLTAEERLELIRIGALVDRLRERHGLDDQLS